jgi:hypothetical protein
MPTIQAGFDFFETNGDAYFTLPHGFSIPEGFFHKGSAPWAGLIRFVGYPIRRFEDPKTGKEVKTGTADTVVARKQDITIQKIPGSGTTEIELVRLSLRSATPIQVEVGHIVQRWDVDVTVSTAKPSIGSMTVTQATDQGGHFTSELVIWPKFRFERRSDGEERLLDMGAMKVPAERQALVAGINTLRAADVPWQSSPLPNTLALPALMGNFAVRAIAHHSHNIIAALQ